MGLKIEREEKRIFHNKTVRLPEDVLEKLNKIAFEKNLTFNKVVLQLIEYSLNNIEED